MEWGDGERVSLLASLGLLSSAIVAMAPTLSCSPGALSRLKLTLLALQNYLYSDKNDMTKCLPVFWQNRPDGTKLRNNPTCAFDNTLAYCTTLLVTGGCNLPHVTLNNNDAERGRGGK